MNHHASHRRRSPSARLRAAVTLVASLLLASRVSHAQVGGAFLLVPFGARAVGRAEAVVADSALGTEAIWFNAAALARIGEQELALHHSQTVFATSDMLVYARPSKVLGTIAGSAYIVNYGDQDATDPNNGQPIGRITNRNYLLALSYASPAGKRLSAGVTYKLVMLRFTCDACTGVSVLSGNTSALDIGAQYRVPSRHPITLGASVRNLGPALQIKDREQADPLPRLVQLGAKSRFSLEELLTPGATLDLEVDALQGRGIGSSWQAVGAAVGFRDQLFITGGVKRNPDAEGSSASIGFGIQRGAFGFDLSRRFGSVISELGTPPLYFSLKARF